ncbi:MAG: rhodanese-like domain-containing protein [Alphaproteobacteria bacterium]|nr:rhodanese-like domain-containing protein [Alphaproteobacteria bacterium]
MTPVLQNPMEKSAIDRRVDSPLKQSGVGIFPALVLSCFLATAAFASDGFDDGSFDGADQTPEQGMSPEPASGGGGGFDDGSFDDGGAQDGTTQPPARDDRQAGGDGFDDGSFDDGGSFDDTTEPPKREERQAESDGLDDGSFDDDEVDDRRQPERREASGGEGEAGGGDDFVDGGDFDDPEKADDGGRASQDDQEITELEPDRRKSGDDKIVDDVTPVDKGVLAFETRDFGVPPTNRLRSSNFHAPTPTSIPGGRVVTTGQLAGAMQQNQRMLVIDVLGGQYALPNAYSAPPMAEAGNYRDRVQQQTNQWLNQITGGNRQATLVIYCSDPHCWLSYNASLRAIAAGYSNVYWYRGGLQAWNMAGLPLASSGF